MTNLPRSGGRCSVAVMVLATVSALGQDKPAALQTAPAADKKKDAVDKPAPLQPRIQLGQQIIRILPAGQAGRAGAANNIKYEPATPFIDQATRRRLEEAQRLLAERQTLPALAHLQQVLNEREDSFVPRSEGR